MESSPSRSVTQFSIYTYSNLIEILHSCHRMPLMNEEIEASYVLSGCYLHDSRD
eukprot:UN1859